MLLSYSLPAFLSTAVALEAVRLKSFHIHVQGPERARPPFVVRILLIPLSTLWVLW